MAINNQERDELHKKIWDIANRLRGSIDGWDFKQYVLGIMFYRYISENIATYANNRQRQAGIEDFDYTTLSDEEALTGKDDLINEKGFFILPSELFINVVKNASTNNCLNETLDNIFKNIESSAKGQQSENDFSGLFNDVDVNSQKLGRSVDERNKKLAAILQEIAAMKLGNYQDNSIDAFGDAYEYLMSMYASNAGKSGGEYFTPQEVSELLTKIAVFNKKKVNRVYDPACGSGSLLLQTIKVLGKENIKDGFYGQEVNLTTYNLCRINMFLHDIGFDKFNIYNGDTLLSPSPEHQRKEPFDVIVSNPPYSI
ncbi:type I restriction-modification system subunit M, partial [Metamycoplasma hominis]